VRIYRVGPFNLYAERRVLMHQGKPVVVGRKAVETLLVLVERAGEAVAARTLIARLWPGRPVHDGNLTQNVYVIRKLFERYQGANPIETVEGGYRFAIEATPANDSGAREIPTSVSRGRLGVAAVLVMVTLFSAGLSVHGRFAKPPSAAAAPESRRLYAMGRYYWSLRSAVGVRESMQYFAEVIRRDPGSPLGYAGMADANATMGDYCYGAHRPRDYFSRARAYVAQALALDPDSAPAHATAGFILLHERQERRGVSELRLALSIDPAYAPAHEWFGVALAREGRVSAARFELESAAALMQPAVSDTAWLGSIALRTGRYAEAARDAAEVRDLSPSLGERRLPSKHPTWASLESSAATDILSN